MVQLPVLTGFSSLNLLWGSQIEVFGPRLHMIFNLMWYSTTCCQLHPQTLPGGITGALLGAHAITHWFLVPAAKNTWHVRFDTGWRVFLRWPRVPVGMLKGPTVPRVRSGERLSASMDATHLIFDKKSILPSGSQTWQLKILYDYIVIAISKHFSSDKSSVRGRFSIAIFHCQYIMYIRISLSFWKMMWWRYDGISLRNRTTNNTCLS